jgi:hypothetical protein
MSVGGARFEKWQAAVMARRRDPSNCSRCGRPNPDGPAHAGAHGTCAACRAATEEPAR